MVRLRPMTPAEFDAFRAWSERDYAAEHVRAGQWTEADAPARARAELERLLPEGTQTPDHYLRIVLDGATGQRVGEVWYALQRSEAQRMLFIYWIGIDEPHRRRGFASEVLSLLEGEARGLEAARIGLHVFGHNAGAQILYTKLGYVPTNILMAKTLAQ